MSGPRVFDLGDRGVWRRTGECSRCGECCLGPDPSPANPLFDGTEERELDGRCPLLRRDGDRYACAGHGRHPFHLAGCADHPRCPDETALTPSCSYEFERLG